MSKEHTQGTWEWATKVFERGKVLHVSLKSGEELILSPRFNRREGAWIRVSNDHARLIAAAPETAAECDRLKAINAELLAALEFARAGLSVHAGHDPDTLTYLARIDAALNKVKGVK